MDWMIAGYVTPSSIDLLAAVFTASMIKPLKPPNSRTFNPAMVVPPGDVTISLSWLVWRPVSMTSWAEPRMVCAARVRASGTGQTHQDPGVGQSLQKNEHVGRAAA